MLVQDLFENRMHDAYSVFQQLAGAVHNSEDIDLRVGHELMPLQSWQARHLLGQYKSIAKRQGPDAAMRFLADYNAITAALDAMDTRLGQMKNMRGSLPGQRAVDETHNHDEPEECYTCRGTGEGQFDGTSCSACGGSGIVRPTRDDDDFDIPDDYDMREAAPDPKHLQRYGHELDQSFPDISNSVADRGVTVPNSKEVAGQTAHPNKHFQSTPFHTNGAKLATVVRPGSMPPRVKRLDTPTTVPNFLKKSVAQEDARPGPLERSAPHTQKKTVDQLTHLQALNGLEETVNAMRAANRRISENLSLMAEAGSSAQQAAKAIAMKKAHKKPKTEAKATKTRLDPKCWTGKHIGTPATKVKGGVRVNNCVPNESVAEDFKQPMKMADYVAQADRLHDEMMRCQHANDEAGYERAKQQYLALERQARQGMIPEAGHNSEHEQHLDSELQNKQKFAMSHYSNYAHNPQAAFDKWVQRSLMHSEEDDEKNVAAIKQLQVKMAKLEKMIANNSRNTPSMQTVSAVAETAATMPPSPAAAAQAKAIVQKAADDRAVSLANMARVVPNNVAEDSGAWPFQEINELSNDKLAQYKSAAGRAATAADRAGNYELGNKRFRGITQATKKQFANDVKKHRPQ